MTKHSIKVFAVSRLGASHIKSGKPCQDYSLKWENGNGQCQIVIVADGHGGSTYVRSDTGSRLLSEITLANLQSFVTSPYAISLFSGKKGKVTARPDGPRRMPLRPEDRSEQQIELLKQDREFAQQVSALTDVDNAMQQLFRVIHGQWTDAITKDSVQRPFTNEEKAALGNNRIAKAYGSTLMAFVRTPIYWLAFHLGDGKMVAADNYGLWSEPVPWDCNCFLNVTTSICQSNPLPSFRYAFDGTGNFPAAVFLGSDGIDDSWCTTQNLHNFYTSLLEIFHSDEEEQKDFNNTVEELAQYLSALSEKGSRDDMSVAGIIDMSKLNLICQLAELRKRGNALKAERDKLNHEVKEMESSIEKQKKEKRQEIEQAFILFKSQKEKEYDDFVSQKTSELEAKRKDVAMRNAEKKKEFDSIRLRAEALKQSAAMVITTDSTPTPVTGNDNNANTSGEAPHGTTQPAPQDTADTPTPTTAGDTVNDDNAIAHNDTSKPAPETDTTTVNAANGEAPAPASTSACHDNATHDGNMTATHDGHEQQEKDGGTGTADASGEADKTKDGETNANANVTHPKDEEETF